jgi:hemin uptake protein HemP
MPPTHIKESPPLPSQVRKPAVPGPVERVVSTKELLAGAHRVWIQHAAERYLLTVTRSGKLILTK